MSTHPTDEELREALARRVQSARLSEPERSDILRAARLRATAPGSRSLWTPAASWLAAAAGVLVLALVMAPILLSPPGSATDGPPVSKSPDPSGRVIDPVIFNVQNGTTLTIDVYLNDVRVVTVEPGTTAEIDPSPLGDAPWHVEARTTSGRTLVAIDAQPGDVWHAGDENQGEGGGVGGRADLSCGRLDVWAGTPLLGPAPPESFPPGDCDIVAPTPSASPSPQEAANAPLREGDRVRAKGVLVGSDQVGYILCEVSPIVALATSTPPTAPECPTHRISIPVVGVVIERVPGWHEIDGVGESALIQVEGAWVGGGIEFASAMPTQLDDPFTWPAIPCDPPQRGWPGGVPQTIDGEDTVRRLDSLIRANPGRYAGLWSAPFDPDNLGVGMVLVVATVQDVHSTLLELEQVYPYNLCVVHAVRSLAELKEVEGVVGPPGLGWTIDIREPENRIVISVPFVDDAALQRVGANIDAIRFDPLVERFPD